MAVSIINADIGDDWQTVNLPVNTNSILIQSRNHVHTIEVRMPGDPDNVFDIHNHSQPLELTGPFGNNEIEMRFFFPDEGTARVQVIVYT